MMNDAVTVNPLTAPLSGVTLIEASAGTGKTWHLSMLFLRLLIDEKKPYPAHQILVVTFTKSAAAELHTRLRSKIKEALVALNKGTNDPQLSALLLPWIEDPFKRHRTQSLLEKALDQFDRVVICTIHAFCRRVLSDISFDPIGQEDELLTDYTLLLQRLASDFWRTCVLYNSDYAPLVIALNMTAESTLKEIRPYLGKPYLKKQPVKCIETVASEKALKEEWETVSVLLNEGQDCFWKHHDGLKKNSYKEDDYIECFEWLEELACSNQPTLSKLLVIKTPPKTKTEKMTTCLVKLRQDVLESYVKKDYAVPEHPLFRAIERLLDANKAFDQSLQRLANHLRMTMIDWIDDQWLSQQKRPQRRIDDLVHDLASALTSDNRLASYVADTWRAALIDEFQDTDPLQYAIFRHAFIENKIPLFLVGDPKQAIYGFRNADIFTYLSARQDATQLSNLTVNYRSVDPMLSVLNRLFSKPKAFVIDIPFIPVNGEKKGCLADGCAPIVWHWFAGEGGVAMSVALATEKVADKVAQRIATLLTTRPALVSERGERPLQSHDIAILVFQHNQGDIMRAALKKCGVSSVSLTKRSVLDTPLAKDLFILMRAWANPHDQNAMIRALATDIVGLNAASLYRLKNDPSELDRYQTLFFACRERWQTQGFMTAWYYYFKEDSLAKRLLPRPDGEKWLTNLTHLVELIQQQSNKKSMGMLSLLTWVGQSIKTPPDNDSTTSERLESDKDLVRIVTVHASKGMEYPVVFCPFLWHTHVYHEVNNPLLYYHVDNQAYLSARIDSDESIAKLTEKEIFAEKVRALYVALTRAQFRLEITVAHTKNLEQSPLVWLLFGNDASDIEAFKVVFKSKKSESEIDGELKNYVNQQPDSMQILKESDIQQPQPLDPPTKSPLHVATLNRPIVATWSVSSFSKLSAQAKPIPFDDIHPEAEPTLLPAQKARYAFPKGSHAGSCLHAILQTMAFDGTPEEHHSIISGLLSRYGFNPLQWQEETYSLVQAALTVPLGQGLQLQNSPPHRVLKEMEFLLPFEPFQATALKALLSDPAYGLHSAFREAVQQFDFSNIGGYLNGFIDLVVEHQGQFYIIDYKLHHLGYTWLDYAPDHLIQTMATSHYYLQYLIYIVAVRAYLRSRALAPSIGGVRYLFLRGLNQEGNGVWSDNPSEALLLALEQLFYSHKTNSVSA